LLGRALPTWSSEAVLLKAVAISQPYSTQVWALRRMHEHAVEALSTDVTGLPPEELVERLARLPGRSHTSLASKFCRYFVDPEGIDSRQRLGCYRWVVERDFAWLHTNRHLRIRYERHPELHDAFLDLGCALICWRFIERDGLS
jgi:hypothetical protein